MSSRCTGFEAPAGLGRRRFLERFGLGLGSIALADLINPTKASAGTVGGGVLPGATSRREQSASSTCSRVALRRRSICTIPSRSSIGITASSCQRRSVADSDCLACPAVNQVCLSRGRPSHSSVTVRAARPCQISCRTRRRSRTTFASFAPCTRRPSITVPV